MQPSNPLIALGVSAIVAASAIGVSPAVAEPTLRHRPSPEPEDASQAEAAQPQEKPQETMAQQPSDIQRRNEDRLDRLQTESQIRQQLNQSQFRTFDRPLAPETNSLQLDQSIQQQINLHNLGRDVGTSPSRSLDRLQFEQRVRQQMRQSPPQPLQQPEPQSQANASEVTESTSNQSPAQPAAPEETPAAEQAQPETAIEVAETETVETETVETETVETEAVETEAGKQEDSQTVAETAEGETENTAENAETEKIEAAGAAASSEETAQAAPETTEVEQSKEAEQPQTEAEGAEVDTAATEVSEPEAAEPEAATEVSEPETTETETTEAEAAETETTETEAAEAEAADDTETAQAESPATPETLPIPGTSEPVDFDDSLDSTIADDTPAPEYLDPDPNPLLFPTVPEEVELVGTQPITLRQAVELAVRNNPTLRQAQLQLERSQADLRQTQASNYPTLDATARFNQSGSETTSRVPETVTDQTGNEVPNPNPDAGGLVRQYSDATALGTGLELNYSVYTSGRRPALIEAARSQVRLQQLEVERQTEQLILDTVGDYYDLQQAGAQVNIFQANLTQAEQSLRDAQALERAGVGTRFDVLQAEVDVANARQRLTQQLSDLEVSRRELVQRLNLSQTVNVSAADPIEVSGVWDLSLEESIIQAYKNRVELEQQLIQREIAQQNRRAALAQLGPQLGLQGAFNLNSNLDNDAALEYNYQVALVASLSLFDGGEARAQANREESNIAIAESEFENVRDQIRLDVERGYSQLNASFTNIQTTALAVEQAAEALRLARLRFQAGVGTQTDVLRQQSVLAEAQVNNLSAILDYNRSLAVLQRAISNYPEGYLNDAP